MPNATHRLELTVTGRVELRGTYYAARNNEFGITTYGPTSDVAEARLKHALEIMLGHLLTKGPIATRARLKRLGIQHLLVEDTDPEPPVRQIQLPIRLPARRNLVPA